MSAGQSLEFAALVLAMLGVFSIFGSGRVSLEAWMAKRNAETQGEAGEAGETATVTPLHEHEDDAEHAHAH